jgi:23S rRNA pseudouridine2605 synthase
MIIMKKRTDNFDKFATKTKGSAVKEAIRQEKRKVKAEARIAGEEMRQRKKDKARGIVTEEPKKPFKPQAGRKPIETKKPSGKTNPTPSVTGDTKIAAPENKSTIPDAPIPLNKFVAHAGVCGRREAAELVKDGKVTVNGDKVFEPGYKVTQRDKILVKGKEVFLQKNSVYILLNKPKDFLTTANDPQGRKTVLDLIKHATLERVYPVGRLDRNTTGVLLLTNDGELAQKLTHPSYEVKKIYEVTLDKAVSKKDLDLIVSGITLEDGFVAADSVGYADAKTKDVVGIEIHSGRNRIVRRIFEHLGYDVKALDRVMFANLTKKNVERSKWRFLNEKEVRLLKYMNKSFIRKNKTTE